MVRIKDLLKARLDDSDFRTKPTATPKEETPEEKKGREELERLYNFIGFYIVTFQDVEAELDQIILLIVGHDRWHIGQSIVSLLTNSEKIELVHSIVMSSALSCGTERQQEWLKSFEEVLDDVRKEGARRNRIVHSLYLLDFMKIGAPPLRTKRRKKKGEIEFERELIDTNYIREAAGCVAELSFDVGMLRRQLIGWHDDVLTSRALSKSKHQPNTAT